MTFSWIESEGTPGNPAPESACIVVTIAFFAPYSSMSGFSTIESPVPVQFGVVAIAPFHPLFLFWVSRSLRCSALISGIISGTSASMRCALASLTTVNPASANFVSTSAATSEGSAEKTMSHPFADSGLACLTTFSAIAASMASGKSQCTAWPYFFPADSPPIRTSRWRYGCFGSMLM